MIDVKRLTYINKYTEEGQKEIQEIANVVEKVSDILTKDELKTLFTGINEKLYPTLDLFYIKTCDKNCW